MPGALVVALPERLVTLDKDLTPMSRGEALILAAQQAVEPTAVPLASGADRERTTPFGLRCVLLGIAKDLEPAVRDEELRRLLPIW
ncbi:MAG TPA: hypothetical protein VHU91_05300, partial [Mycobacteriales bacterium]|nr:hypothetical protein [Mycobacteriales bacterium]